MGQVLEAEATQVIETDETGKLVIPAELLRDAQPFTRYQVKAVGKRLSIEPELIEDEWLKQWRELAEEIGKVWPEGVSAVDVVSEMRR